MTANNHPSNRSIGDNGEEIAVKYLKSKGYQIIDRNYQIKGGELDIVMGEGELTIFVEVKYRKNEAYGHPLDTFTWAKRRAMKRTIMLYSHKNKIDLEKIRIDFIGIMPNAIGGHRVWHVRGVEV
ncbi:YraN family protein [Candidatus Gracilibacteria bacterium]|nr:YraN family protein [Candidatus Gracilibacteria bacterium]